MEIDSVKINICLAELGITKAELAKRCGMSRQNVSTIVRRGTCEPKTAGKLAKGLNCAVSDLLKK